MSRLSLLAVAVLALNACAVGPDYARPEPEVADEWLTDAETAPLPEAWWALLDDPVLDRHLERAARQNLDIRAATARVDEARAARGIARSAFRPQAGLDARYTRFEQSLESPGAAGSLIEAGLVERDVSFYTTTLDASWELDLFGGTRRQAQVAGATLDAVVAERDGVRLAALSETAAAYFELQGARERLAIVEHNVAAQQRTLELTRRKVDAGLARRIDALRAEAQLDSLRARQPALRAAIRASRWRLAVLTARAPGDVEEAASTAAALPVPPESLPVGLRADVLRRRPDVIAAERRLAAATAGIGVAKAEFFPKLVLTGSYAFESESASDIGTGNARQAGVVPFVSWPVFQGGRLRANLEGADARARQAAFRYEQVVLVAIADAESALTAYDEELASFERLSAAARSSREAAGIAQKLYEQGLADFLTVLDAEQRRDEAEAARVESHTRLLLNLVRVYKSLGGGWER